MSARAVRLVWVVLVVYAGLLFLTYNRLASTPTGLIPQLDRSYLIAAMQLPPGSTLERADRLVRQASEMIMATEGVSHAVSFVGFGTFKTANRKARTARNPQTGAAIKIPKRRVPRFAAGKALKQAVK